MKAILIDPTRREVRGIEVEPTNIAGAFGGTTKTLLLTSMVGWDKILYFNGYALQNGQHPFWFQGCSQVISGKALLLGRVKGQWPVPTQLSVREAEQLVRFRTL